MLKKMVQKEYNDAQRSKKKKWLPAVPEVLILIVMQHKSDANWA